MNNWISITKDTLNEASIAALIEACDSAALGDTQAPRSGGLIQGVVHEVRTAIQGCKTRLIDADETTIPASLRDLVVDLVIARLKSAIQQDLTQDERDTVAWRRRTLHEIRDCDYPVEKPDSAVEPEIQAGASAQVVQQSPHRLNGHSLNGL